MKQIINLINNCQTMIIDNSDKLDNFSFKNITANKSGEEQGRHCETRHRREGASKKTQK